MGGRDDKQKSSSSHSGISTRSFLPVYTPLQSSRRNDVGDKFYKLWSMYSQGLNVPAALCLTADVCIYFLNRTGLRERIRKLVVRKSPSEMSAEEVWDLRVRIENMFLSTPYPKELKDKLQEQVGLCFQQYKAKGGRYNHRRKLSWLDDIPLCVRPSPSFGDSGRHRGVRLFPSHFNIRGLDSLMRHILSGWASMWSDSLLLFRQEVGSHFGIELEEVWGEGGMPLIVQYCVQPTASGVSRVCFPSDKKMFPETYARLVGNTPEKDQPPQPALVQGVPGLFVDEYCSVEATPDSDISDIRNSNKVWMADCWLVWFQQSKVEYTGSGTENRKYVIRCCEKATGDSLPEGLVVAETDHGGQPSQQMSGLTAALTASAVECLDSRMVIFVAQLGLAMQSMNAISASSNALGAMLSQEVEWALVDQELFVLQCRDRWDEYPDTSDNNSLAEEWKRHFLVHRPFTRSIDQLEAFAVYLSRTLEPKVRAELEHMASVDIRQLSDSALCSEVYRRHELVTGYRRQDHGIRGELRHGARLLGLFYQAVMRPDDPFEFVRLLVGSGWTTVHRNYALLSLVFDVRNNEALVDMLKHLHEAQAADMSEALTTAGFENVVDRVSAMVKQFGSSPVLARYFHNEAELVLRFITYQSLFNNGEVAIPVESPYVSCGDLEKVYLSRLQEVQNSTSTVFIAQPFASSAVVINEEETVHGSDVGSRMLRLGRASTRAIGDFGLLVGQLEAHFLAACYEAQLRIRRQLQDSDTHMDMDTMIAAPVRVDDGSTGCIVGSIGTGERCILDVGTVNQMLESATWKSFVNKHDMAQALAAAYPVTPVSRQSHLGLPQSPDADDHRRKRSRSVRMLYGEPAGPGIVHAQVHFVRTADDIMLFRTGSVLVCEQLDANINFLVPIAAAVVERSGGMMTAGAVAAREYSVPCVTGISRIDSLSDGDFVTVDGFLGAVTVHA